MHRSASARRRPRPRAAASRSRPSRTSSRVPPLSLAITGMPAAIASSTALGEPWCVPSTTAARKGSPRQSSVEVGAAEAHRQPAAARARPAAYPHGAARAGPTTCSSRARDAARATGETPPRSSPAACSARCGRSRGSAACRGARRARRRRARRRSGSPRLAGTRGCVACVACFRTSASSRAWYAGASKSRCASREVARRRRAPRTHRRPGSHRRASASGGANFATAASRRASAFQKHRRARPPRAACASSDFGDGEVDRAAAPARKTSTPAARSTPAKAPLRRLPAHRDGDAVRAARARARGSRASAAPRRRSGWR